MKLVVVTPAAAVSAPLELTRQSRFQSEEDGSAKLVKPGAMAPPVPPFLPRYTP